MVQINIPTAVVSCNMSVRAVRAVSSIPYILLLKKIQISKFSGDGGLYNLEVFSVRRILKIEVQHVSSSTVSRNALKLKLSTGC